MEVTNTMTKTEIDWKTHLFILCLITDLQVPSYFLKVTDTKIKTGIDWKTNLFLLRPIQDLQVPSQKGQTYWEK